jgi:hypothetical protein
MNKVWRLWCKALGKKALDNDREADYVAGIRTIIFITYFITNLFIIVGVIRHWNDIPTERLPLQHQSIQEKHS